MIMYNELEFGWNIRMQMQMDGPQFHANVTENFSHSQIVCAAVCTVCIRLICILLFPFMFHL